MILPPVDVYDVNSWRELPKATERVKYRICNEGKQNKITSVATRNRQVLEALIEKPVVASSRCRISARVAELREPGFLIDTMMYYFEENDRYGIYVLRSNVECISKGGTK